jgi:hypothetical protein
MGVEKLEVFYQNNPVLRFICISHAFLPQKIPAQWVRG